MELGYYITLFCIMACPIWFNSLVMQNECGLSWILFAFLYIITELIITMINKNHIPTYKNKSLK